MAPAWQVECNSQGAQLRQQAHTDRCLNSLENGEQLPGFLGILLPQFQTFRDGTE